MKNTAKFQLNHFFKNTVSSVFNQFKYFLALSLLITFSFNAFSVDDSQQFNKETYLDLSKPYEQKNPQSVTKKDNQATTILKEVAGSARTALGSTNSDNVNQLGNKITTDIKGQLKNQAISNVESRINNKANEYANSFGKGKTEISIHKITSKNPNYSLRTLQPLTPLNDDSTELTFVQAQLSSGENFGERRSTLNLGVGYRQLLGQGQSIAGVNLFTDYESKSKHKRGSVGLEYQRANFNLNVNKYFPLSDKKVIGDDTEDPLAGYDVKFSGQVPYLPWVKVKATRYIWNGVAQPNVKGTIFGIEVQLSDSVRMAFGSEDNNTTERKTYARFTTALPLSDHESMTNFSISKKAFQNSDIVNLGDLEFVERSNKIRVEKLLNGIPIILGEYNAPTVGASCTLYNSSSVALGTAFTGSNGQVNLVGITSIPAGLVTMACTGGTYTDEATQIPGTSAPSLLRAATIYPGTGPLTILASPLSEIAYRMTDTSGNISNTILVKNVAVATAFGLGVDIIATIPSNANAGLVANDDAGKVSATLAIISQMAATSSKTATKIINVLKVLIENDTNIARSTKFKNAIGDFQRGASVAAGKTSIKGNIDNVFDSLKARAIRKISLYNGEANDPVPTVRDYEDVGVSVTADNLAQMNGRIAAEDNPKKKDTTAKIQSIINGSPVFASFDINKIIASVPENIAFISPEPTFTGKKNGAVTWAINGGDDADKFTY